MAFNISLWWNFRYICETYFFIIFRKLDFCRHFENIRISDQSRDFASQVWNTDWQVKIITEKRAQEKHFDDASI